MKKHESVDPRQPLISYSWILEEPMQTYPNGQRGPQYACDMSAPNPYMVPNLAGHVKGDYPVIVHGITIKIFSRVLDTGVMSPCIEFSSKCAFGVTLINGDLGDRYECNVGNKSFSVSVTKDQKISIF